MGRRSRRRTNEEVQAELEPLDPGEIPGAVKVAAAIAALIALGNLVGFAAGLEVRGEDPKPVGVMGFSALMLIAAVFMLRRSYWAVLGFQALLALVCIVAALSLMVASNLYAAVLCLVLLAGGGTLFWFLVRAMARIQMPERPDRVKNHG
jgi:hypothetical protein